MTPQEAQDMLHYAGADGFTAPELCLTAELAAHAPIMAEQIANQQYEYAVQVLLSDGAGGYTWHFADEDSLPFGSLKPYEVRWYTKKEAQEILDAEVDCFGPKDIRIVRRLVSESEVVE